MKAEKHYCLIHPDKLALSICNNCKSYFCSDCLEEGATYFYCRKSECQNKLNEEMYYATSPVFCPKCISQTSTETTGSISSFNGFGIRLGSKKDFCTTCNSYIQNLYFTLFFVPIIKKGSYRVKSISKNYGLAVCSRLRFGITP